jgi:hypothetical protein
MVLCNEDSVIVVASCFEAYRSAIQQPFSSAVVHGNPFPAKKKKAPPR